MGIANTQSLVSTRNNVFGFQSGTLFLPEESAKSNCQWLADLGFSVSLTEPDHWIVTHKNPLPELHFYSERELAQFASYKAHHYARRLLPETRP